MCYIIQLKSRSQKEGVVQQGISSYTECIGKPVKTLKKIVLLFKAKEQKSKGVGIKIKTGVRQGGNWLTKKQV